MRFICLEWAVRDAIRIEASLADTRHIRKPLLALSEIPPFDRGLRRASGIRTPIQANARKFWPARPLYQIAVVQSFGENRPVRE